VVPIRTAAAVPRHRMRVALDRVRRARGPPAIVDIDRSRQPATEPGHLTSAVDCGRDAGSQVAQALSGIPAESIRVDGPHDLAPIVQISGVRAGSAETPQIPAAGMSAPEEYPAGFAESLACA
jgi:hypothetical protein